MTSKYNPNFWENLRKEEDYLRRTINKTFVEIKEGKRKRGY